MSADLDKPGRPRVLVVDDSRIVRASLARHLASTYEVIEASDGEQAWATLNSAPGIGLMLTDLTMPGLDGYGLIDRLRQSGHAALSRLPVVVVSGTDDDQELARAQAHGAQALLSKGASSQDVLATVARLLGSAASASPPPTDRQLTPNLAAFEADLERRLAQATRHGAELMVLALGLDWGVEEKLGRVFDVAVAQLLARTVRQEDVMVRHSQGRFLLLAPGIGLQGAERFARRVGRVIEAARVPWAGETRGVRPAVGIAGLRQDAEARAERLIGLALDRLQQALSMHEAVVGPAAPVPAALPLPLTAAGEPDWQAIVQMIANGRATELEPHRTLLLDKAGPLLRWLSG